MVDQILLLFAQLTRYTLLGRIDLPFYLPMPTMEPQPRSLPLTPSIPFSHPRPFPRSPASASRLSSDLLPSPLQLCKSHLPVLRWLVFPRPLRTDVTRHWHSIQFGSYGST